MKGGKVMGWFARSYKEYDFEMFSLSHFVIMGIFILIAVCIFLYRDKLAAGEWRKTEIGFAVSLIIIDITYHLWMIVSGNWNVSNSLPLEMCSISLVLTVLLLLTRKKIIYEVLLFTALIGASQAIITPSLNYDFPHFRFFHFFYTHMMITWVTLYFTWAKGYRPTIWSVVKLMVFLNILMPIILLINKLVDGNYMFLSNKPDRSSLLDVLGPYPWYILSMEGLAITLSLIVWLVFREKDKHKDSKNIHLEG
jgi:hypothetical integral membrane protein (TIGR02206 family)